MHYLIWIPKFSMLLIHSSPCSKTSSKPFPAEYLLRACVTCRPSSTEVRRRRVMLSGRRLISGFFIGDLERRSMPASASATTAAVAARSLPVPPLPPLLDLLPAVILRFLQPPGEAHHQAPRHSTTTYWLAYIRWHRAGAPALSTLYSHNIWYTVTRSCV